MKHLRMPEAELVRRLARLAPLVDGIVVHPDAMDDPRAYRPLGSCLVLENMDARKPTGRTVAELAPYFAALPEAGFCLDVAHVLSVDPSMEAGERLLDAFAGRLRQLHVSSVDEGCRHVAADGRARGALRRAAAPLPRRALDPRGAAALRPAAAPRRDP